MPVYPAAASMAWPIEWPRLSTARRPCSWGSSATTRALNAAHRRISSSRRSGVPRPGSQPVTISHVRPPASSPVLITSANPAAHSRSGSVSSTPGSATTHSAGWNAPT